MVTRRGALGLGKKVLKNANARRDAEVLLMYLLRESRADLYRDMDKEVPALVLSQYREFLDRRRLGCPIQYLTGKREFMGLDFIVTEDVLIPRPETEILVELAIKLVSDEIKPVQKREDILPVTIADVGTGSGAIAVSLAKLLTGVRVYALDVSGAALTVAKENARLHGVLDRITFLCGDFLAPLKNGRNCTKIDLFLSNPPYIPTGKLADLPPEVRDFEPLRALDGGRDGLDFYRQIAVEAPDILGPGGWLLVEVGQGQAAKVKEIMVSSESFTSFRVVPDWAGIPRVIMAKRKGVVR